MILALDKQRFLEKVCMNALGVGTHQVYCQLFMVQIWKRIQRLSFLNNEAFYVQVIAYAVDFMLPLQIATNTNSKYGFSILTHDSCKSRFERSGLEHQRSFDLLLNYFIQICKSNNKFSDMYDWSSNSSESAPSELINGQFPNKMPLNTDTPLNKTYKKKSTLTAESKDLLLKLDILKKQMQKNVVQTSNLTKELLSTSTAKSKTTIHDQPIPKSVSNEVVQTETSIGVQKCKKSIDFARKISDMGSPQQCNLEEDQMDKISMIRKNIIGFNTRYMSPFNIQLESVYVDHTATNRPYKTVEDMIDYAKRFAANPHTEFSHFGKFSTEMMHYAQNSLIRSFGADNESFVALPTGSGSTGAIEKALKIMNSLENQNKKHTIYITPYEHHSNILPWVEFYDNINVLASDEEGNLLIDKIEEQLVNSHTDSIIVSISAASNVTSTLTDLLGLNKVIKSVRKKKDTIFSVDCAAYCCHQEMNLKKFDQIDFIYLSPHKNLGGAEACGVLIARKNIVKNAKPTFPGGGTVAFVKGYTKKDVMYDVDIFNREIAGTPPFLGFYRAALSFELLKNEIGYDFIHERQQKNTKKFIEMIDAANMRLKQKGEGTKIVIYGDKDFSHRANVITFNIISKGSIMQHNLVSLILADVFGVQLRSGCFCAGPFGMQLLKLDEATVEALKDEVSVGILKDKPGYLRLDLTFYLQIYEIEFLANAIIGVADYSKTIGLVYTLCNDGQITRHKLFKNFINDKYSLGNADFAREYVAKSEQSNLQRLRTRRDTLEKQYKRGMNIVMKPIQFLRSQINAETY